MAAARGGICRSEFTYTMVHHRVGAADGLVLRHYNGSNYVSEELQREIAFFRMEISRSFVRQPQCNGVAERFIRTLNEQIVHGRVFASLQDLREELDRFAELHNER